MQNIHWGQTRMLPSHSMNRTWASSTRKHHSFWNQQKHPKWYINIQHARKTLESIWYAVLVDKEHNKTRDVWYYMGHGQEKYGRLFHEESSPMASKKNDMCLPTTSFLPSDTPNGPIFSIQKHHERVCYSGNSGAPCAHIIPELEISCSPGTYKYCCCTSDTNINIFLIDLSIY